jgi:hypothetical protein
MDRCDVRAIGTPAGAAAYEFRSECLRYPAQRTGQTNSALCEIDIRDAESVVFSEDVRLTRRLGILRSPFVGEAHTCGAPVQCRKVLRAPGPARRFRGVRQV